LEVFGKAVPSVVDVTGGGGGCDPLAAGDEAREVIVGVVDGGAIDDGFDEAISGIPGEGGILGDGHVGVKNIGTAV